MFEEFKGAGPGDYRFRCLEGAVSAAGIGWCQKHMKDWHYSRYYVQTTESDSAIAFRKAWVSRAS